MSKIFHENRSSPWISRSLSVVKDSTIFRESTPIPISISEFEDDEI